MVSDLIQPMALEGRVLITGGAGFLGRSILRRAEREKWDARFTVYSRDEAKQQELKRRYPDVTCVLGDVVRDLPRLIATCTGHDTVIHAAAVKFIPEAERNVLECIDVNVEGSKNVGLAAIAAGVSRVIGISTDKACAPLNLYGATKMVMERLFSELNRRGGTRFVTARYGNVVGSTGSVIPVFRQQLADTGKISVTDPRMTRFWLSPDDAVDIILWALDSASELPGYTFIPACASMSIVEIANAVWIESGGEGPTPINIIGMRPGEKLAEQLINEQEAPRTQIVSGLQRYRRESARQAFWMLPATERANVANRTAYSSDDPARWMGMEEMLYLMADTKEL